MNLYEFIYMSLLYIYICTYITPETSIYIHTHTRAHTYFFFLFYSDILFQVLYANNI